MPGIGIKYPPTRGIHKKEREKKKSNENVLSVAKSLMHAQELRGIVLRSAEIRRILNVLKNVTGDTKHNQVISYVGPARRPVADALGRMTLSR